MKCKVCLRRICNKCCEMYELMSSSTIINYMLTRRKKIDFQYMPPWYWTHNHHQVIFILKHVLVALDHIHPRMSKHIRDINTYSCTCVSQPQRWWSLSWHRTNSIIKRFGGSKVVLSINKVQYSIVDITWIKTNYTRNQIGIVGKIGIGRCSMKMGIAHSWFVINT